MKFWEAIKVMMEDGRMCRKRSEIIYRITNNRPQFRLVKDHSWEPWEINHDDYLFDNWQLVEEPKVRRVNLGVHWLDQLSGGAYVLVNNDGTNMQSYPLKFDPETNECYVEIQE